MVRAASPPRPAARVRPAVIWHDLECGRYRADLAAVARAAPTRSAAEGEPVLDIGAGTGRVSLDLARDGHP